MVITRASPFTSLSFDCSLPRWALRTQSFLQILLSRWTLLQEKWKKIFSTSLSLIFNSILHSVFFIRECIALYCIIHCDLFIQVCIVIETGAHDSKPSLYALSLFLPTCLNAARSIRIVRCNAIIKHSARLPRALLPFVSNFISM